MGYSPQFDPATGRPLPREGSTGTVRLVSGQVSYIDATPGYTVPMLVAALAQANGQGLEVLDPADPLAHDVLEDGTIRTHLRPISHPAMVVTERERAPTRG
jgi:hypothetical protein